MTTSTSIIPNVALVKGQPMTNSRDVAELFGKRHAEVLRAMTGLYCSPEFTERNFALSEYRDSTTAPSICVRMASPF
ncbi:Rha family transcriptional regulator [Devosia sp. 2618]|uniref:Rha family transcriptional regulator n=1 Tax=Devosia sp. 2618 TaxID=3156454 RepID=UPI00339627CD